MDDLHGKADAKDKLTVGGALDKLTNEEIEANVTSTMLESSNLEDIESKLQELETRNALEMNNEEYSQCLLYQDAIDEQLSGAEGAKDYQRRSAKRKGTSGLKSFEDDGVEADIDDNDNINNNDNRIETEIDSEVMLPIYILCICLISY